MIRADGEAVNSREIIHRLEIAQSALRIALAQHQIEPCITFRSVHTAVLERTVDRYAATLRQQSTGFLEQALHFRPRSDMQSVGGEDRIGFDLRPCRIVDVERY